MPCWLIAFGHSAVVLKDGLIRSSQYGFFEHGSVEDGFDEDGCNAIRPVSMVLSCPMWSEWHHALRASKACGGEEPSGVSCWCVAGPAGFCAGICSFFKCCQIVVKPASLFGPPALLFCGSAPCWLSESGRCQLSSDEPRPTKSILLVYMHPTLLSSPAFDPPPNLPLNFAFLYPPQGGCSCPPRTGCLGGP